MYSIKKQNKNLNNILNEKKIFWYFGLSGFGIGNTHKNTPVKRIRHKDLLDIKILRGKLIDQFIKSIHFALSAIFELDLMFFFCFSLNVEW